MKKGRIIALSGIDGAGKSTIIRNLKNELGDEDFAYVTKSSSKNFNYIKEFYSSGNNIDEWLTGRFAKDSSVAAVLDYIDHYKSFVAELHQTKISICDRYVYCYIANYNISSTDKMSDLRLNKFKKPDMIIHLDVDIENALSRLKYKSETDLGESREVLMNFKIEYQNLYSNLDLNVINVDANRPYDDVYLDVKRLIIEFRRNNV